MLSVAAVHDNDTEVKSVAVTIRYCELVGAWLSKTIGLLLSDKLSAASNAFTV
jgi:hypothetical protein